MDEFVFDVFGGIGEYSYGANYIDYYLKKAGDKPVRMRLSSYGGSVFEAIMCAESIRKHGNVTVEIIGKAASAATFMPFSAKSIEMHEDAFFLVHNSLSWVSAFGMMNKEQIQQKIEELKNQKKSHDAIDMVITQKYMDRSGKTLNEVVDLMKENRWMTAEEALQWGFIDKIIKHEDSQKPTSISAVSMEMNSVYGLPEFPDGESPKASLEPPTPQDSEGKGTGWSNFFARLDAFWKSKSESTNSTNNTSKMRTQEKTICSLLNVTGLEEKDGCISLTAAQLETIEARLNQPPAEDQTIKSERDALVNLLDSLDGGIKNAKTPEEKITAFNSFIEQLPVAGVIMKHKYNEGETNYSDVAVDPINTYQ